MKSYVMIVCFQLENCKDLSKVSIRCLLAWRQIMIGVYSVRITIRVFGTVLKNAHHVIIGPNIG